MPRYGPSDVASTVGEDSASPSNRNRRLPSETEALGRGRRDIAAAGFKLQTVYLRLPCYIVLLHLLWI